VIFSLTRYPAPDRNRINTIIAARYANAAAITMGRTASSTIKIKNAIKPMTTSRSRASIQRIFAPGRYRLIDEILFLIWAQVSSQKPGDPVIPGIPDVIS